MDLKVTIEIWQKVRWYVARCPELDFVSQGATQTEARHNLLEVIQIQFEEMTALGRVLSFGMRLCQGKRDIGSTVGNGEL